MHGSHVIGTQALRTMLFSLSLVFHLQAVGASVRIFELLDRVSEIKDGTLIFEPFKGGVSVHV